MAKNISITRAKAQFAACIIEVEQGESILITRHGKPVAALVPAVEYEQFERLHQTRSEQGLASVAGSWEGAEELVQEIERFGRSGVRQAVSLD